MADDKKPCTVGDLLEYRCPRFGLVTQWQVIGVYLGGLNQESLIELKSTTNTENDQGRILVPEQLTRDLFIAFSEADHG